MYLNCHTYFSFRYGTFSVEGLFDEARRCGVHKLALTDINNTSGYIEMLRICNQNRAEYNLEIALGIEFRSEGRLLYIGLAENNEGFEELNRYLSHHNTTGKPLLKRVPEFVHAFIIYPFEPASDTITPATLRENEFIGIRPGELTRLATSNLTRYMHKLVALAPVTFRNRTGFNIHRLLRAIDKNTLLSKLDPRDQAGEHEIMLPEKELVELYLRFPELLKNSRRLLTQCSIRFELGTDKNKANFTDSKRNDRELLMSLAMEGFDRRFDRYDHHARSRLFKELDVISSRNFESYFLIAHDNPVC